MSRKKKYNKLETSEELLKASNSKKAIVKVLIKIKSEFIPDLKCFFGFHNYKMIHRGWTYIQGVDIAGKNRRAYTKTEMCLNCHKKRTIVSPYKTISNVKN